MGPESQLGDPTYTVDPCEFYSAYNEVKGRVPKALSRVLRRDLSKSHFVSEIRLLKRCKTANLSRVSRQALGPDLRRDTDSPSYIV